MTNKELDKTMEYFFSKQDEFKFITIWSIYEKGRNINKKHDLGNVHTMEYEGNKKKIKGSTWKSLWKAAEKLVIDSNDFHHIFIEDFVEVDSGVVRLHTGS